MNNIMVGESELEQVQRISNQRAAALDRAHKKIERLEKTIERLNKEIYILERPHAAGQS